jgi:hypothetical protein
MSQSFGHIWQQKYVITFSIYLKSADAWATASKGRIIHGPAIRGQEFLIESSSRYIICRQRHADDRYGFCPTYLAALSKELQRVYGCQ